MFDWEHEPDDPVLMGPTGNGMLVMGRDDSIRPCYVHVTRRNGARLALSFGTRIEAECFVTDIPALHPGIASAIISPIDARLS